MSKGVVATLKDEIRRINEEAQGLEVGSEEYLNSSKAVAQLADSVNKLDKVDVMQLCKDGTMIILFALLLIFNLDHIIDSKIVNVFRNFFRLV